MQSQKDSLEEDTEKSEAVHDFVPRGHFYSPFTNHQDAERSINTALSEVNTELDGVKIDDEKMLTLWDNLVPYMAQSNFPENPESGSIFHYLNNMFSFGDADVYSGMISYFKPKKIIEIGSGYSSAVAVQTTLRQKMSTKHTFIEPFPITLKKLFTKQDWTELELIPSQVQEVNLDRFTHLEKNDILFVDSSHVAKAGSDVLHEVFRILPKLASGVIIHFHDCFWPFEYPAVWVRDQQRNWTELYLLRAFLMYNSEFEIIFFNDYFARKHREHAEKTHQRFLRNSGGGLYLRRK